MADNLSWDEIEVPDEEINEDDIKTAELSGRLPPMKFLGECVDSVPREAKFEAYSCYQANLKWEVMEVLEVGGKKATEEDQKYEGKFQYDQVTLGHPSEKDGMRNRRILVAKRCGLINNTSDAIPKNAWSELIIGCQAIITTETSSWEDKITGEKKSNVKVKFDGYEAVENATSSDSFDDI